MEKESNISLRGTIKGFNASKRTYGQFYEYRLSEEIWTLKAFISVQKCWERLRYWKQKKNLSCKVTKRQTGV